MLILFYGPHLYKAAAKFTHAVYQMVAGLAFFQAAGVSLVVGFPFRGQILNEVLKKVVGVFVLTLAIRN